MLRLNGNLPRTLDQFLATSRFLRRAIWSYGLSRAGRWWSRRESHEKVSLPFVQLLLGDDTLKLFEKIQMLQERE
jgi:hypothetical protein